MIESFVYRIQGKERGKTEKVLSSPGKGRADMDSMKVKALAKINLGLDVLGKRADGYHEIRMIMQTIHLYDQLIITKKKEPSISIETNLDFLPVNENNLVYRAAKLMKEQYSIKEGVHVVLKKHIPVAAGMAGGSTDAAAVMYGMNELFGILAKRQKLMELGVKIGADVPFCLMRGTALAEGIGEKLKSLPPVPKCPVLIAKPGIGISTKYVYENLRLDEHTSHPDIDAQLQAIFAKDLHGLAGHMGNLLESVTITEYPIIQQIKEHMKDHGALNAMMSGSGPTVFGLFEEEETARKAYEAMQNSGLAKQVFLTSMYNNRKS